MVEFGFERVLDERLPMNKMREFLLKKRRHKNIPFDIFPVPTVKLSDLDRMVFEFEYLPAAIHQIIYNAVFHRDYESNNSPIRVYWFNDRVEMYNPGGPYGMVTIDNLGMPGITDYRNPNPGEVLNNFGFIQAFGRGIPIA